ncbi:MAG: HDIG domain-containing protein [Candidatus Cloacimonadota bacterium]|nr:HDIG domain-containing protein [Candidatus Cloacimonadota bacterium]
MKKALPAGRISHAFINIGIATLIIFIADFLVFKKELFFKEPARQIGEIATQTIVAPFDFLLYEDAEILAEKQKKAEKKILPHFYLSLGKSFNVQEKINTFFGLVENSLKQDSPVTNLQKNLLEHDYQLTIEELRILKGQEEKEKIYKDLTYACEKYMSQGIVKQIPPNKKIIICYDEVQKQALTANLLTKQKAIEKFETQNKEIDSQDIYKKLTAKLLDTFLEINLSYDTNATQKAKKIARLSIPNITSEVLKNELIVQNHQKIDANIFRKLEALEREKNIRETHSEKGKQNFFSVAKFVYIYFVLTMLIILVYLFKREVLIKFALFRCMLIFTVLFAILLIVIHDMDKFSIYFLPIGMPIILLSFLIDIKAAIIYGIVNFFLIMGLNGWEFAPSFIVTFSGLAAVLALNFPKSRRGFYQSSFYILVSFILLNLLFSLINGWELTKILDNFKWGFFSSVVSLLGSMVLLAPIEQRLPVVTNIHLLEVGDFSNKLLKTLSEVASGTYHHSIIVGNLAETAAKAIQANPILARVGSYYHDIGKTKNPEYFIENIGDEKNIHSELNSTESALIIKHHVEDGVKLAHEYHLPTSIIDIIQQHHGTATIYYFFKQAQKNGEKINENNFHYDGPKPQTKEAAIVMIADIVESTTKSLEAPSKETINQIVEKAIDNLIKTDQLSECGISLQELKALQKSFEPILVGMYKKRIVYPE